MVEFRDYFDNLLAKNGYKENKDGFYNGQPNTKLDNSYFLSYDFPTIARTGNQPIEYTTTVTIDFFFKGFKTVQETQDKSFDKVNFMLLEFLDNFWKKPNCFRSIDPSSMSIRSLDNNDRNIVITLEMTAVFNRSLTKE